MTCKLKLVLCGILASLSLFSQKINKAKLFGQWELTFIQKGSQVHAAGRNTYLMTFYSNDYMVRCRFGASKDSIKEAFKVWHIQRDEFILSNTELDSNIYMIRSLNDSLLKITFYNPFEGHMPDFSHIFKKNQSYMAGEYPHKIMGEVPFLINSADTTQKIRIKGESGTFHLSRSSMLGDTVKTNNVFGTIVSLQDSTVRMFVKEENTVLSKNKFEFSTNTESKNINHIKEYNLNEATLQFEETKKHAGKHAAFKITTKENQKSKEYWYYTRRVIDLYE